MNPPEARATGRSFRQTPRFDTVGCAMQLNSRRRLWPILLLAVAAIGVYAYSTIQIEPDPTRTRPRGGPAEIEGTGRPQGHNVLFILIDTLRVRAHERLRLFARDDPFPRQAGRHGRPVRPQHLAVVVDQVLDGLDLVGPLSAPRGDLEIRPHRPEPDPHARRDPVRSGLQDRRALPKRLGQPLLRIRSGLRALLPTHGLEDRSERPAPAAERDVPEHGRESARGRRRVPSHPRPPKAAGSSTCT